MKLLVLKFDISGNGGIRNEDLTRMYKCSYWSSKCLNFSSLYEDSLDPLSLRIVRKPDPLLMSLFFLTPQGKNESADIRFLLRLSAISCFLPGLPSAKNGFLRDSASCRATRQEAIYRPQQSRNEIRNLGKPRRKPSMTVSLARKRKLANVSLSTLASPYRQHCTSFSQSGELVCENEVQC